MNKPILLFITLLFSVATLYAQTTEQKRLNFHAGGLSNEDFFIKSDLVVESRFLGIVATYDIEGNKNLGDIYSITAMKVHRVFKGDKSLEGDTIYFIEKGNTLVGIENTYYWRDYIANLKENEGAVDPIYEIQYPPPHPLLKNNDCRNCNISDYASHIYFFKASDFPDIKDSKYTFYKKYKFLYNSETRLYVCGDKILGLNNLVFQNRGEFYDYIKQFEGFLIPESLLQLENKPE